MVDKTDDEQLEDLKRWWEKNGKFIILLLIVVISSVVGGKSWQSYKDAKNESASVSFDQMLQALQTDKADEVAVKAGEVIDKHADTQYAVMSALSLAKTEIEKGELDSASQRLNWALETAADEQLKHIIRIRLARVMIAQGQNDAALQAIAAFSEAGKFSALYAIVRGDAQFAKGEKESAVKAYQEAIKNTALAPQMRSMVQMKLEDLGAGENS